METQGYATCLRTLVCDNVGDFHHDGGNVCGFYSDADICDNAVETTVDDGSGSGDESGGGEGNN